MSDVTAIINSVTAVVAAGTFIVGVISAKRSWDEKRRDTERAQMERRQAEVHRLMDSFGKEATTFNDVFDYDSDLDAHLRLKDLLFTAEEQATRTRTDRAFEHLRDLHRSLRLGLISSDDLSFWTYWLHRVPHRIALAAYARACGYEAFMTPLREASREDPQLADLTKHCPWWPREKDQALVARTPAPSKTDSASAPTRPNSAT